MTTKIGRTLAAQAWRKVQTQLNSKNDPRPARTMSKVFMDSIRIKFQGGRGGNGCISMLSLFANEFAGPDGGNGGNGGHVVLRANSRIKSLNKLSNYYRGHEGTVGMGKDLYGANAEHIFVDVPVGTLVMPAREKTSYNYNIKDPDESNIIAELYAEGAMFIAARGGAGGRGNAAFLSNKNRHPRIAEAGALGEENTYELRLKTYAHVALIGLPNAGKSTLLRNLTGAKVKIGDYAFTTLHPQVGTLQFDDYSQVAISDLPGLIEDSHKNRGLGLQFLESLQRCACMLYVVDLSDLNPIRQFETLVNELESHKSGLSRRPHLVFGNKIDTTRGRENLASFTNYLNSSRPESQLVVGSCNQGEGLGRLRDELKKLHDEYQAQNADNLDQPLTW